MPISGRCPTAPCLSAFPGTHPWRSPEYGSNLTPIGQQPMGLQKRKRPNPKACCPIGSRDSPPQSLVMQNVHPQNLLHTAKGQSETCDLEIWRGRVLSSPPVPSSNILPPSASTYDKYTSRMLGGPHAGGSSAVCTCSRTSCRYPSILNHCILAYGQGFLGLRNSPFQVKSKGRLSAYSLVYREEGMGQSSPLLVTLSAPSLLRPTSPSPPSPFWPLGSQLLPAGILASQCRNSPRRFANAQRWDAYRAQKRLMCSTSSWTWQVGQRSSGAKPALYLRRLGQRRP